MCMECDEDRAGTASRQERIHAANFQYPFPMRIAMGLDGGGTKTDCVLMDETGRILARARGGPSNSSRIGVVAAATGVKQAASAALQQAAIPYEQITDVCAGLA